MIDKMIQYERMSLNRVIAEVEKKTGNMFHEEQPETDIEIHELAWNNAKRLFVIRINLIDIYKIGE